MGRVRVILGDTDNTPYGGGTWASRGAGIGGEAALQATRVLRKNILDVAAAILQATPGELDIVNNGVVNADDGAPCIDLKELARIVYFRPDTLPPGIQPELMATRHFVPRDYPFAFTNGVQASWLEVDTDTGFVKLLKHWVVEDCGTIINPQLVDEQIRGGVVQGLGAALFEKCIYDEQGQLTNANMADYLVPMSGEMPDIDIGHGAAGGAAAFAANAVGIDVVLHEMREVYRDGIVRKRGKTNLAAAVCHVKGLIDCRLGPSAFHDIVGAGAAGELFDNLDRILV